MFEREFASSVQLTLSRSKSVAFSTTGNETTRDNIINVFSAKTLQALVKLDLKMQMQPTKSALSSQYDGSSREVKVEGHISRPTFGEGRQAPDRQMFFVNSRPCGLPQVSKAFNEVYKTFNVSQSPFVFANLIMDTSSYDVNVSPDKRTILLHDQGALLESLKEALMELFEAQEQSVPQSKLASAKLPAYKPLTVAQRPEQDETEEHSPVPQATVPAQPEPPEEEMEDRPITQKGPPERLIHNWVGRGAQDRDNVSPPVQKAPVQNAFDRMRPQRVPREVAEITIGDQTTRTVIGNGPFTPKRKPKIHIPKDSAVKRLSQFAMPGTQLESGDEESAEDAEESGADVDDEEDGEDVEANSDEDTLFVPQDDARAAREQTPQATSSTLAESQASPLDKFWSDTRDGDRGLSNIDKADTGPDAETLEETERQVHEDAKIAQMIHEAQDTTRPSQDNVKRAAQMLRASKHTTLSLSQVCDTSTNSIIQQANFLSQALPASQPSSDTKKTVTDNIDQADAEERLSLTVSKSDFAQMSIVGQFNLGFVLAIRPPNNSVTSSDLFIIDQHAADEKYNFERYSNSLALEPQRLAQPKQLYLTAIDEEIVLEHTTALTANGFLIDTDTSGESPVGTRCKLLALPMSKETTFDLSDLEELLHLLSEHAGSDIPRPSKVRKMLAMRACRSSIMVGKNLTKAQMTKVVSNLGQMDKPWNCPHGRPTMRHLADIDAWDMHTEETRKTDWKGWVKKARENEAASDAESMQEE